MRIDLNCDLGESFGPWSMGKDDAVMPSITSASIACGFHAGDPAVMRCTVELAKRHGVAIGAHPGFPDLAGFGRREMQLSAQEVEDLVLYQIAALAGIARAQGVRLQHVKPHGALYRQACRDAALATAIARAVDVFDGSLILVGLPGSELLTAGARAGLRVAAEAFADRAYRPDGSLAPRHEAGSVLHNPDEVVARALRMVCQGEAIATDRSVIRVQPDTICLHGDTPESPELARQVRRSLEEAGVAVRALAANTSL